VEHRLRRGEDLRRRQLPRPLREPERVRAHRGVRARALQGRPGGAPAVPGERRLRRRERVCRRALPQAVQPEPRLLPERRDLHRRLLRRGGAGVHAQRAVRGRSSVRQREVRGAVGSGGDPGRLARPGSPCYTPRP
jgi:hypothetical protein